MKLFIAAHFLILSFVALGVGVWQKHIAIGVVVFVIFQAIAFYVFFKTHGARE